MNPFNSFRTPVRNFALALAFVAAALSTGLLALVPAPAEAQIHFVTSLRTSRCQAIVTAAGASAVAELRTGNEPTPTAGAATLPTATGTLLATVTFGSVIGTCGAGALDFDEAGITQNAASHVAGTPGHIRLKTAGGTAIVDVRVCAVTPVPPCWTFTGTVATGQNITGSSLVFTEGNV